MKNALRSAILSAVLLLLAGCATTPDCCKAPKEAETKTHWVKYGTNNIHYFVEGTGAHTLVLIHCWAGNLGFWRYQVPALSKQARLVLIDLPGHGQSDKPHVDYTMDYFAGAVQAVMDDAHVDKATLIGHSMGVPVICRVYAQAPERVAALVAVDGALRRPNMTAEQTDQFIAGFRDPDYQENMRRFLATLFPVPGTEALRDTVISEMLQTPQYVLLGAMEGMFGTNQPDWDLQHAKVPVIVINAPNPMWTDEYKEYARSLSPQTEYHSIEGVGHWLMLEKPMEFNSTLTESLGKYDLTGH